MYAVRWIGKQLERQKWLIVILCLLQGFQVLCGIANSLLMRHVIDHAVSGNVSGFWYAAGALVAVVFIRIVVRTVNRFLEEESRTSVENNLRKSLFTGILKRDYRLIEAWHTGELMNRMTSDTALVADGAVTLIPAAFSMLLQIIGVLTVLNRINSGFSFVFLVGGCLMAAFSLFPRKWLKRLHCKVQEADGVVRCFLQECLESLLVIHTFCCEEKMQRENLQRMDNYRFIRRKKNYVSNLFNACSVLFLQCGYLFGIIWCGVGIIQGNITYGTLTAVIQLIGQVQTPFLNFGGIIPKYAAVIASTERLMVLADTDGLKEEWKKDSVAIKSIYDRMVEINFNEVTFGYEKDRPVIVNESFIVKKGEIVAIAGSSGAGKSTLMKLLLSVYVPQSGEITLSFADGSMLLSEVPPGIFGYVPQGNHLMSGTIWEVVGFASQSKELNPENIIYACKAACAHEFIMELPEQYNTVLGERGRGLSEGQMQRLAVARAIYSNCPILILDEATSALDSKTEQQMIMSLKTLPNRTVFFITHRKKVWNLCDRILKQREINSDKDE